MTYNPMSHVGLEADYGVSPEMLKAASTSWHYGWEWRGPEPLGTHLQAANGAHLVSSACICDRAPCGLITVPEKDCFTHKDARVAAAKQLHKAADCPSLGET